jgi:ketosteroid isomerase-like protein
VIQFSAGRVERIEDVKARRKFPVLARRTVAVLLLVAAPGAARAAQSAAETVLELDARRVRAMVAGDVAALDRIFDADLVYTHTSGRVDGKEDLIGKIRSGALKYVSMACRDTRARVAGAAVIVTGKADLEVAAEGKGLAFSMVFTAFYIEKDGRWQMTAYQSTRLPAP